MTRRLAHADGSNGARSANIFREPKNELEAAVERYVDLYDFAPIAYVSFDRAGRISEANLAATELLQTPRDFLIGRPFALYVADLELFMRHLLYCRTADQHVNTELCLKSRKRELIPVQLSSTPVTSTSKNGAQLYQTAIIDLSERERTEKAVREKEAELELIVTQTPFMLTRCTRDLRYRYVSRAYADMLGRKPEEIAGKPILEVMGEKGVESIRQYIDRVLAGETVAYEEVVPFKDIGPRVLSVVYVPDRDRGEVIGWVASMLDVSERRRREQQLRVRDAVSSALAGSDSLKEATPRIIEAICDAGDWEVGAMWDLDHATGELYCLDFWHRRSVSVPEFESASRQLRLRPGLGLSGRVWLSGKPAWLPDLKRDDNFLRASAAVNDQLHSGLCFPIKLGEQLLGLVECFSRDIREPDEGLLQMFTSIGSQLGQFVERKQAEERFRLAVESAPNAMVMVNQKGKIVLANSQTERVFGYTREELLGKSIELLVLPRFRARLADCRRQFSSAPESRMMDAGRDLYGLRKDGSEVPVEIGLNPIRLGGQTLILSSIVDITEGKRAEQQQEALYRLAIRQSMAASAQEIYEAALDAILAAVRCDRASILLCDENQEMRFVAWRGLSEKYRKAVEGHSPWTPNTKNPQPVCVSDVDLADIPRSLKTVIRKEGIRAAAFIPLVSDKTLIGKFMAYYKVPHTFSDNELKLATTISRQLAQAIEHHRDEQALRESEARMRATVEQATAGVARCDTTGRILFANRRLCQLLGYTASELVGKSFAEFTHPDHVKDSIHRFTKMVRDGNPYEFEKRYIRKNGSVIWADVSASAVLGSDGKTQSAVSVIVDVTARKKAEAALQRSKQLLELRVRARTLELHRSTKQLEAEMTRRKGLEGEILSVSDREQQRLGQELHDGLCQHLTAVAFMTRSIALRLKHHRVVDAGDIEKVAELVNQAAVDTRNLSRALHRVDVDAAGLLDALQDLVDREIWRTPCRLQVRPSVHLEDDAAAAHLYRIAREAVINANKHAQARQIVVRLEQSRQETVLRVIDDGIGFPKDLKPQQGLGYHIMSYRAQLMGGRLEIDSPKNKGTRVSCYLPHHVSPSRNMKNGDQPAELTETVPSGAAAAVPNFRHLRREGAANG